MSQIVQTARKIPGVIVGTGLHAARVPLNVVARAAGQRDNDEWPPAMVFETAEAAVETTLGSLLGDDDLVARGRLRQTRVAKLKEAAQLEAVAEQERLRADDELDRRRQAAEERREQVEETAEQREERVVEAAQQRQQQVTKAAAQRKTAAKKQAAAADELVDKQERAAALAATAAETRALDAQREALVAEDEAAAIDETIAESREVRTTG